MIYLIKTSAYTEEKGFFFLLKIGYTDDSNLNDRMMYYKISNPTFSMISTREGSLEDEKKFHEYFKRFKYPELNEWFYYNEKIIKEFSTVDISNVIVTLKSGSIAKRIKAKLMKLLPKNLRQLAKKGSYHYHKGDSEEETLSKFYYSKRLWEKGLDHKKFYIHELSEYKELLSQYYSFKEDISKRIKFICDLDPNFEQLFLNNLANSDYAKSYYLQLGKDKCRALGYNVSKIRKELGIRNFNKDILDKEVYTIFNINSKITRTNLKVALQQIYDSIGYSRKAKASDIESWFEVKSIQITVAGKREHGFEIIKRK